MCISISCHPVMDNMPESEEEMTLESLVDLFTKEACWPKDGQLQIIVEADGSTGIASTLQYVCVSIFCFNNLFSFSLSSARKVNPSTSPA